MEVEDKCIQEKKQDKPSIDTVFRNTKKSTDWFAEYLGNSLQRSSYLCHQQRKNDIYLIRSYFLPLPIKEQGVESKMMKEANHFISPTWRCSIAGYTELS